MIQVQNVAKTYPRAEGGSVEALKSSTFGISAGEFVAVRGSSGSGKSTLLNILGCLDRPSSGSYWLDSEDVARYSDKQLSRIRNAKIGFIFQAFNLLPRTTALENVEIPMVYRDGRVDKPKALAALERVGLAGRTHHYSSELSGGEQQRVAIARALINNPVLILADEPTGNLDRKAGLDVMTLLGELHREGRTILTRSLHLQDGQILEAQDRPAMPLGPGFEDKR